VRQFAVGVDNRIEKIRRALEHHAPSIELVGHYEAPSSDDDDKPLGPPFVNDADDTVEDMSFIGRNLCYRIVALSDGAFALIVRDADHREKPRIMLRHENNWRTLAWLVILLERNRIRTVWNRDPVHLEDEAGKRVLTIAWNGAPVVPWMA
jgi:hypothetical protein